MSLAGAAASAQLQHTVTVRTHVAGKDAQLYNKLAAQARDGSGGGVDASSAVAVAHVSGQASGKTSKTICHISMQNPLQPRRLGESSQRLERLEGKESKLLRRPLLLCFP